MKGESRRVLRVVGGEALRADPKLALTVVLLRLGAAVLTPLDAVALGLLIDAALRGDSGHALFWAACFAVADAGSSSFDHPASKLELTLREKTNLAFESRIVTLSTELPTLDHLERSEYHDRIELARNQSSSLGDLVSRAIAAGQVAVLMVVTLVALVTVHWLLLLLALFAVPTVVLSSRAGLLRARAGEQAVPELRLSDRLYGLATAPGTAAELRVLGTGPGLLHRYDEAIRSVIHRRDRAEARGMALVVLGWLVFAAGFLGAVELVVWRATHGDTSPGQVLIVVALAVRLHEQIADVTDAFVGAQQALIDARRLLRLMELIEGEGISVAAAPDREASSGTRSAGIEVRNLSFRYGGSDTDVLRDVSLSLPAGSTVALVGENGAGKTTLVKLLCGLYESSGAQILVNGAPPDRPPSAFWPEVTACFQDFVRFELPLRESIGIGQLAELHVAEAVERAAREAGAGSLVEALPQGLDTQLGERWPGGVGLSLGQWQQVALGRMLMRPTASLFVLDEPTASLDVATEQALFERFSQASRRAAGHNAITLLVSHRFSTVRSADLIVVLEAGAILATGTHDELMAKGGLYAELFGMQSRGFR